MTTATTQDTELQVGSYRHDSPDSSVGSAATGNSTGLIGTTDGVADKAQTCLSRLDATVGSTPVNTPVDTAKIWAADLAQEAMLAQCTTIGLISGSRDTTSRCVIDAYTRLISDALTALRFRRPMLIVRLDASAAVSRRNSQPGEMVPSVTASLLGPWSEVTVSVAAGKKGKGTLESLSYLLPKWKREFGFVLVDLGPIAEASSRLIGGHCDSCFVVLGPESCGSHEWLLQHIAWHARSGSTICGTLVTELE